MTDSWLVLMQKTLIWWESLGAQDARQGNEPRPLPGIDSRWVEVYEKGYQEASAVQESEEEVPF